MDGIFKQLEVKGQTVREVATALSQRIEQFDKFLNTITGRTKVEMSYPNFGTLKVDKAGKTWAMFYSPSIGTDEKFVEFRPLMECSIFIKMQAVKYFRDLPYAMAKSQTELLKQLRDSINEYDAIYAGLLGAEIETPERP